MPASSSGAPPKRPALILQIKLPCASLAEVRARYGEGLRKGLFFVRTAQPRPVGTVVKLEAQLRDGSPCFRAAATVARIVESPQPEPGMELQLIALDEPGRGLLAELDGPRLKGLKLDSFAGISAPPPARATPAPPVRPTPLPPVNSAAPAATQPSTPAAAPEPAPVATPPAPAVDTPVEEAAVPARRAGPVIGIDLGTSNVCVAVVTDGKPRVIASREGHNTIPSVVALDEAGALLVGHRARRQLLLHPQSTVHGTKRLLGRAFESPAVRAMASRVAYLIVAGAHGDAAVQLGDRRLPLQEIAAMILREAKALAENDCDAEITRAVITVPARYSERQRQAVREAAVLAGLSVERLLSEPTAAALAFAHGRNLQKRMLVYDLGGGTFDASLLELRGNVYEVLATGGDSFLGGVDFDRAIVDHLLQAFRDQHGIDFPGDRAAQQRLHDSAERAKIALSEQLEVRVREPFIATVDGQPLELNATLSRSELVLLTGHLVDKTLEVCAEVLRSRGFASRDLNEVLLVGGQSRMPLVRERLRNLFGLEPSKAVHPDEAVALGAALLAHELETSPIDGTVLVDVLPLSIRLAIAGGGSEELLARNTQLPAATSFAPRLARDGQGALALAIFQGDDAGLEQAEYLGTIAVSGFPPGPRGSTPVEVELSVDAESMLAATAREKEAGAPLLVRLEQSESAEAARQREAAETAFESAAAVRAISSSGAITAALGSAPAAASSDPPLVDISTNGAPTSGGEPSATPFNPATVPFNPATERAAAPPAPPTSDSRKGWLRGIFGKKK